ncbi:MAG: uroporphyrinogen-III decarboxylase-like protein [Anaerolineae bacterium]|nr:uroporphyrinogen-III decarboxylase-like protein [Anaerolineae bacterium]
MSIQMPSLTVLPESPFVALSPDWEAFRDCILRKGTPARVHHIELFLDGEVQEAIAKQFRLWDNLDEADPAFPYQRAVRIQRFLGYDYVRQGVDALEMPLKRHITQDTADMQRAAGRSYVDESRGPISNWAEFEAYPWPDPEQVTTRGLEWYEQHLPDDMCVVGSGGFAHFAEYLTWLMGYETLCYALYNHRDLVQAIAGRLLTLYTVMLERILEFNRVKIVWGSDDMGFKTGPMISPDDLRAFVLPGHKQMAAMAHAAGKPYLLHSCGNLNTIMTDLIEDVQIDAKHSFEDTIEDVRDLKFTYGKRIALLGGIDVDFLCRTNEVAVRERVRNTLEVCMPGGGYCLGTGNSVTNYIPLKNYLAMVEEGRKW